MPERRVDEQLLRGILHGEGDQPGLFEQALGFGSATGAVKEVHLMNDLAQCVLGGAPAHRGDHLCRVIREHKADEEPTADADMRADPGVAGEVYRAAYPSDLSLGQVSALRAAAKQVLNFDGGMYRAGDNMASGLATHRDLLGSEGFRRFGIGRYLLGVLGEGGRARLEELYTTDRDPVSRFLRPLMFEADLEERYADAARRPEPTPFDEALGRRLTVLLSHPLSKPTLLRYLALSMSLGLTLRMLGAGRQGCRPVALLLPQKIPKGPRPVREEAVQAFARGIDSLDRRLAALLAEHPLGPELWEPPARGQAALTVSDAPDLASAAGDIISAARAHDFQKRVYWPDEFVVSLGRRSGCVWPRSNRAGWGRYAVLTTDHLEALVLMFAPPGAAARPWRELWRDAWDELGVLVGANEYHDAQALRSAGVVHVNMEELSENSSLLLAQAIRRGVARRLPDSGAEAGGELL